MKQPKEMKKLRNAYREANAEAGQSFDLADRKSVQVLHIVGHGVCCRNCMKEIAAFYCPCGAFLCSFDMLSHKCLITLRQTFSDELTKALR